MGTLQILLYLNNGDALVLHEGIPPRLFRHTEGLDLSKALEGIDRSTLGSHVDGLKKFGFSEPELTDAEKLQLLSDAVLAYLHEANQ